MLPNRFVGLSWSRESAAVARVRALGWAGDAGEGWLLATESAMPRPADRLPPFRTLESRDGGLVAETDHWGLGHIFIAEQDGVVGLASSATLLAQIFGLEPDVDALMDFALFGAFIGTASPFHGVAKLPAGHRAVAKDGALRLERWFRPEAPQGSLKDSFVAAVAKLNAAAPGADLELSGGLDSRLILAAMPPEERRRHHAVTIGGADSGDVRVARQLARREGLEHQIVDLADLSALDADGLHALLTDAALGYDYGANPVDKAPIIHAGAHAREAEARFGGQNGEILRGFYYPGQPIGELPDAVKADRLIAWRLIANDRVLPGLFDTGRYAAHRERAGAAMRTKLLSYGGDWGQTLDRFYLDERMQRWVGISCGNRFVQRRLLYPFFDPDFVAHAMALPPSEKAGSKAAYSLLADIDPGLAAIALDNGVVPARPGRSLLRTARKAIAKIRQRLGGRSKPTLGSGEIAALWHRHRLYERLDRSDLDSYGVLDMAAVDAILRGETVPDRATLGFLLLLTGIRETLRCGNC